MPATNRKLKDRPQDSTRTKQAKRASKNRRAARNLKHRSR